MKLFYVATHQIHNLTPLFRELSLKDKIHFKAIYWQKISSNFHDPEFNTKVNFGVDQFSGYEHFCLFDEEKSAYDLSFFFKLKVIPKIIKLILKEDFDAIVFHSYLFPNIIAAIVAKLIGKKTIMRSISYNLGKRSFIKNIIRNIYYRFSNLFLDQYWTCHKLNEDFFVSFGAKKKNCFLIDHCQGEYKKILNNNSSLLISKNEFCKKHDLPKDKKFILFAGRFIERANPKILFEAFADANLNDDWFLIMAGHGKFKKEITTAAENKKVKNLKFLGFQSQNSIINFFQHSEILVLPSGWNATNGNIASEGIQFGCALIISNMVGLYPEFVKEEVGLVFDVEKKEELINCLKLFTNDSNLLNKYQKNALEYGKKKTPEYSANLIIKALDL
jgi:glycosyltransferase involved in cell wall biosynthesis